jgi:hypothetical protein
LIDNADETNVKRLAKLIRVCGIPITFKYLQIIVEFFYNCEEKKLIKTP